MNGSVSPANMDNITGLCCSQSRKTENRSRKRVGECRTLGVWQGYYKLTRDYFTHITLADLMNAPAGDNYVI